MRRPLLPLALLLFLSAPCTPPGANPPPPEPEPTANKADQPCVPPFGDDHPLAIIDVWHDAGKVHFCLGSPFDDNEAGSAPLCYSFDPAADRYDESTPAPKSGVTSIIKITGNTIEVCASPGAPCKNVLVEGSGETIEPDDVSLEQSGTRLAVIVGADESEERWLHVYEVDSGKRSARFRASEGDYLCNSPQWLGTALAIHGNVCAGPGGLTWIVDPKSGDKKTTIGDKEKVNTYGVNPVRAKGEVWAFLDAFAADLVLQDVQTGEVSGVLALSGFFPKHQGPSSENTSAAIALPNGQVAVVLSDEAAGIVIIVDEKAKLVAEGRPRVCPAP